MGRDTPCFAETILRPDDQSTGGITVSVRVLVFAHGNRGYKVEGHEEGGGGGGWDRNITVKL